MLDILISLIVIAAISAGVLVIWQALRGRPTTRLSAGLRGISTVIVITILIAYLGWQISASRQFQFFGAMVSRVETSEKVVALTFDDGPSPGATEDVIAVLDELDVRASFYLVGSDMERHPELCPMLLEAGHEIGNHTYSHTRLVARPMSYISREFESTDALIRDCGYEGTIYVRTPFGKRLIDTGYYLASTDRLNIFFDVEPESIPNIAGDGDAMAAHVLERTRPGSIILFHVMANPARAESLRAVSIIVEGLRAQGYEFVTVSELLQYAE
jgi:peptidoglycan-N-acetylglucosamine deacetylase